MKQIKYKAIFISLFLLLITACNDQVNYFIRRETVEEGYYNSYNEDTMDNHEKSAEEKLRVAILLPLSGKFKNIGESLLNSIQLSLFENNKKNITLKIYNTEGSTFGAVNAINKAILDGIDVVIGPLFSTETKAIKDILRRNNLIAFSLSNDQELMNIPNVFVAGSIPEQEIQALISYMKQNDLENYVALLPNTTYGAATNKILRSTILNKDGLLIKSEYYEPNDKNLITKISDLVNFYEVPQTLYENYEKKKLEQKILGLTEEVELIVSEDEKIYPQALFVAEGGKIAEQIANLLFVIQRDSRKVQLIGTSKLDGDDNVATNPYLNNAVFVGANPEKYKKFSDKYYLMYKKKPIKMGSIAYDLVNIVDEVFTKNKDNFIINKEAVLNPLGFDGIDGKFRFLPNGLVERKMFILQLQDKEKVVVDTNQEFLNY